MESQFLNFIRERSWIEIKLRELLL